MPGSSGKASVHSPFLFQASRCHHGLSTQWHRNPCRSAWHFPASSLLVFTGPPICLSRLYPATCFRVMAPVFSARLPALWKLLNMMAGSLQHSHTLKAQSSNKTMGDSSFGARRKAIIWSLTAKARVLTSRCVSPFQQTQHLKPKKCHQRDRSVLDHA